MKKNKSTFKFKPFSDKQLKVLTWWCKGSPVNDKNGIIADGAIRSGKTLSMSLSFVLWSMQTFNKTDFAMCGKTIASFRRNVLKLLKVMLIARGYNVKEYRADNYLTVSKNDTLNYFYIFGGKDEGSQDLIQGMTLGGVFLDEVALMPESFVNQATGRCSLDGSKFWFNCNPENPYHWFKTEWIDCCQNKNMLYLHFDMDDNLSLSQEVKQRYVSMYSGVFYERFILGLWKIAEGLVYDMFSEETNVISPLNENDYIGNAYVSCDYGTQNPTAFLMWRKWHNKWVCSKEYYYNGREMKKQKTDSQYADDLINFIGDTTINNIVVDPAASSFIAEIRGRGLKVQKADNDVLDGIREVSKRIQAQDIVFTKECLNTIKEFNSYKWDEKAAERGEDKPVKTNDHAMDATRYFVFTVLGRTISARQRPRGL